MSVSLVHSGRTRLPVITLADMTRPEVLRMHDGIAAGGAPLGWADYAFPSVADAVLWSVNVPREHVPVLLTDGAPVPLYGVSGVRVRVRPDGNGEAWDERPPLNPDAVQRLITSMRRMGYDVPDRRDYAGLR
jgi:hypothetical protein